MAYRRLRLLGLVYGTALLINSAVLVGFISLRQVSPATFEAVAHTVSRAYDGLAAQTTASMHAAQGHKSAATLGSRFSLASVSHPTQAATSHLLLQQTTDTDNHAIVHVPCATDADCGHGICRGAGASNSSYCRCDCYWVASGTSPCAYELYSQKMTFVLSFFAGTFGVDWFYLSRGHTGYIVAGVFKALTLGGCTLWSTIDWLRVLCSAFRDGEGHPLFEDLI
jgi:hypothetical protein